MDTTTSTTTAPGRTVSDRFTAALGGSLSPDVRFRALVPPGPFELSGPPAVTAQFEHWFCVRRTFGVLGHSTATAGSRAHAQWTIRRTATGTPLTAEQHVFRTVGTGIESIDLLCSGCQEPTQ